MKSTEETSTSAYKRRCALGQKLVALWIPDKPECIEEVKSLVRRLRVKHLPHVITGARRSFKRSNKLKAELISVIYLVPLGWRKRATDCANELNRAYGLKDDCAPRACKAGNDTTLVEEIAFRIPNTLPAQRKFLRFIRTARALGPTRVGR